MAKASNNIDALIKRIQVKTKRYKFKSTEGKERLTRIALLLENQTKINVRRQGLVDTGHLLNSIQSKVKATDTSAFVTYGSFGVSYAGVHEFGSRRAVTVGAFTRRSRGGDTHTVREHVRQMNIRARPYIRPTLIQQRRKILSILKSD